MLMNNPERDYQEALKFLYSFVDHSMTRNLNFSEEKFNLDRMLSFSEKIGNPHLHYPVVHIAGTKGKGSTSAMISNILSNAGYKVGLYTSPHLQDFCERIQINQKPIPKTTLVKIINRLRPITEQLNTVTTFDLMTAAGFIYFADENVDIAVIEVGLGGRLDSTNIVKPILSVITSVSIDHEKVLGDSLEKIAYEKAGIIKHETSVVVSPQEQEVMAVIRHTSIKMRSDLLLSEKMFTAKLLSKTLTNQILEFYPIRRNDCEKSAGMINDKFIAELTLVGQHQIENAITALTAVNYLMMNGYSISIDAIKTGFANVVWPGRFEVLRKDPPLIIDSAHNKDSAIKLRKTVDDYLPDREIIFLVGFSEDKDVIGILQALAPRISSIIATESFHPRAFNADKIKSIAVNLGINAEIVLPLEEAVQAALNKAGDHKAIIATGSIFIAAGVRDEWNKDIHA